MSNQQILILTTMARAKAFLEVLGKEYLNYRESGILTREFLKDVDKAIKEHEFEGELNNADKVS